MQITLTIPDDIAALAQARGLSVEAYVQDLIEQQARPQERQPSNVRTREEIESFFLRDVRRIAAAPIVTHDELHA